MPLPPLSTYKSYSDAAEAFEGTDQFKGMAPVDRVSALDHLKAKYQGVKLAEASNLKAGEKAANPNNEQLGPDAKFAAPLSPEAKDQKIADQIVGKPFQAPTEGPGIAHRIREAMLNSTQNPSLANLPLATLIHSIAYVMPDNNAQAAIDAMTLANPEIAGADEAISMAPQAFKPLLRMGMRVAKPAFAGLLGGATEGDAPGGAKLGAIEGLGNEAVSSIFGAGKAGIAKLDLARLSGFLQKHLGEAADADMKNPAQFVDKVKGGKVLENVKNDLSSTVSKIDKMLTKKKAFIQYDPPPSMAKQFPQTMKLQGKLSDFTRDVGETEDIGWSMAGKPTMSRDGEAARSLAMQAEDDIAKQIDKKAGRKASTDWIIGRHRVRLAKTMTSMLKEVPTTGGTLNWQELQKLASDKYAMDLRMSLGPDATALMGKKGVEDLNQAIFRSPEGGGQDVQGKFGMYVRYHPPFGFSTGQHPQLASHAGDLPYNLGRGKALTLLGTLGPYRSVQVMKNWVNEHVKDVTDQQPNAPTN